MISGRQKDYFISNAGSVDPANFTVQFSSAIFRNSDVYLARYVYSNNGANPQLVWRVGIKDSTYSTNSFYNRENIASNFYILVKPTGSNFEYCELNEPIRVLTDTQRDFVEMTFQITCPEDTVCNVGHLVMHFIVVDRRNK